MDTYIERADEEIRRTDHLIYVSLKYTRTVDVLETILNRLIKAFGFAGLALFEYLIEKKIIESMPDNVVARVLMLRDKFPNPEFDSLINFYLMLRKIVKEEPVKSNEFRRGVRMSVIVDKIVIEIDIDTIEEFYKKTENFIRIAKKIMETECEITPAVLGDIIKGVRIDIDFERG